MQLTENQLNYILRSYVGKTVNSKTINAIVSDITSLVASEEIGTTPVDCTLPEFKVVRFSEIACIEPDDLLYYVVPDDVSDSVFNTVVDSIRTVLIGNSTQKAGLSCGQLFSGDTALHSTETLTFASEVMEEHPRFNFLKQNSTGVYIWGNTINYSSTRINTSDMIGILHLADNIQTDDCLILNLNELTSDLQKADLPCTFQQYENNVMFRSQNSIVPICLSCNDLVRIKQMWRP